MLAFPEEENGETIELPIVSDVSALVRILISTAYPELVKSQFQIAWGGTSSFAQIQWDESRDVLSIKLNKTLKDWHEACIIGLLSHELSHPAQRGSGLRELKTDTDAISRGFGPYLAVERLFAGKYEDYVISRGRDRYMGYASVRRSLTQIEIQQLDKLLAELHLIPSKPPRSLDVSHDIAIVDKKRHTTLTVEGHQFSIPEVTQNPDIKLVHRGNMVYVYADEVLIGEFVDDRT